MEVEVTGPGATGTDGDSCFSVNTVRNNPAATGVVTGHQTYSSFLSSLLCELLNKLDASLEERFFCRRQRQGIWSAFMLTGNINGFLSRELPP